MSESNLPANKDNKQYLPTLEELYSDKEMAIKRSELNVLINQPPKKEWIKEHPIAKKEITGPDGKITKVPVEHIPIERLQWLMRRIYGSYTLEILDFKLIGNSVAVHVRIYFKDPLTKENDYTDGIGAVPIQTGKGEDASDFSKIKSNAIQIGLPAAKTYAEKDAISSLGKLFGSDLNRLEESSYISLRGPMEALEIHGLQKDLGTAIRQCPNDTTVNEIVELVTTAEETREPTAEEYKSWIKKLKEAPNKSK